MKKRIQIDGKWYVEESTIDQEFDVTFTYTAHSGIFDYSVCIDEIVGIDEIDGAFEINKGTECITAYLNGRNKEPEYWDNSTWLRDFRDGLAVEGEARLGLTDLQTSELQDLLIAVTEKGWL